MENGEKYNFLHLSQIGAKSHPFKTRLRLKIIKIFHAQIKYVTKRPHYLNFMNSSSIFLGSYMLSPSEYPLEFTAMKLSCIFSTYAIIFRNGKVAERNLHAAAWHIASQYYTNSEKTRKKIVAFTNGKLNFISSTFCWHLSTFCATQIHANPFKFEYE